MAGKLDPKQLAQAGATNGQVLAYSTSAGKWQPTAAGGGLPTKSGKVLKASFTGNPKKATVTFGTAFADADYSVALTSESTGNTGFGPAVNTPTASGFVINMNANNITNLVAIHWVAVKNGEV